MAESRARLRALIAEDEPISRLYLTALLKENGLSIASAGDGREAVALCERERFDLIIMDIGMPCMDGLAALRIIRAREAETGFRSHVVALTGYAGAKEVAACLEAGADDYLTKPVEEHLLLAKVAALRRQRDIDTGA